MGQGGSFRRVDGIYPPYGANRVDPLFFNTLLSELDNNRKFIDDPLNKIVNSNLLNTINEITRIYELAAKSNKNFINLARNEYLNTIYEKYNTSTFLDALNKELTTYPEEVSQHIHQLTNISLFFTLDYKKNDSKKLNTNKCYYTVDLRGRELNNLGKYLETTSELRIGDETHGPQWNSWTTKKMETDFKYKFQNGTVTNEYAYLVETECDNPLLDKIKINVQKYKNNIPSKIISGLNIRNTKGNQVNHIPISLTARLPPGRSRALSVNNIKPLKNNNSEALNNNGPTSVGGRRKSKRTQKQKQTRRRK
jgi:hypothetical protein